MSAKTAYTYTVLRYVHDVASGEFLNVGVALFAPGPKYVNVQCRTSYQRLRSVFPTLDGESFRTAMRHVIHAFERFGEELRDELPLAARNSVMDFAQAVLGADDSSLQWSPMGSGVTADPDRTLEQLFERFVLACDRHDGSPRRQDDDDVWRHFSRELQQRQMLKHFGPKTIATSDDQIEFKHAWKNGVWHCLAPVSFDLASAESIREKAHRWLGQLTSVKESSERFRLYFLVAPPSQSELKPAFLSALRILEKSQVDQEVFSEADAGKLSDLLAAEVREHEMRDPAG